MAVQHVEWEGTDEVPSWSGSFQELPSGLGAMLVYLGDERTHRFPEGWSPLTDEPLSIGDTEVWICVPD